MKVLVVAPHPDDESIGCGGALRGHVERGDNVTVVYLTSGELGLKKLKREEAWSVREREARKAAKILGLAEPLFLRFPDWTLNEHIERAAEALGSVMKAATPEIIYVPHPMEWHPDHKAAVAILGAAIGQYELRPQTIRGYEIWTPMSEYDRVENIDRAMALKLRAIRAHKSQLAQFAYDRAIRGLNEYRGAIAGRCKYAEVFKVLEITAKAQRTQGVH